MNNIEAYWLLFFDTLVANIAFTFKGELVNKSMIMFGKYNKNVIILISAFACTFAGMINYIFGAVLYNIYKASPDLKLTENYNILKNIFFIRNGVFLLLNLLPIVGNFATLIAGFIRLSVVKVSGIMFCCRVLYYLLYF